MEATFFSLHFFAVTILVNLSSMQELEGYLLVVLVGEEKGAAGQLVVTGPGDKPALIGKK